MQILNPFWIFQEYRNEEAAELELSTDLAFPAKGNEHLEEFSLCKLHVLVITERIKYSSKD